MGREDRHLTGSSRLVLVDGVAYLHPEDAVFEAMIEGWKMQQFGGRRLQQKTVRERESLVRRFMGFTNGYPWTWSAGDMDGWMVSLLSTGELRESTVRHYQQAIRLFCDYLVDPRYEWADACQARFGTHPVQVCHEWNTVAHLNDYEGGPDRRPLTREELQRFFDYADRQVEIAVRSRRKGALQAYRDATVFKAIYGWGLRRSEASKLDIADFYRNPEAPELGRFGLLQVRYGKRKKGSAPRRRTVATLMPWAAEAVEDYLVNIRDRFGFSDRAALWLTERGSRLRPREINTRFAQYRDALKLPADLTPHCLRHFLPA